MGIRPDISRERLMPVTCCGHFTNGPIVSLWKDRDERLKIVLTHFCRLMMFLGCFYASLTIESRDSTPWRNRDCLLQFFGKKALQTSQASPNQRTLEESTATEKLRCSDLNVRLKVRRVHED